MPLNFFKENFLRKTFFRIFGIKIQLTAKLIMLYMAKELCLQKNTQIINVFSS